MSVTEASTTLVSKRQSQHADMRRIALADGGDLNDGGK